MKGTLKKTALQLVTEFSVPMIISIAWTSYVLWGKELTVQSIGANFGGAFFFVSWMSGQFFRVRKQASVEESFGSVEKRLNHLIDELETKSQHMIGYITGGDSHLYFLPLQSVGNKIQWLACHSGEYPLHQVTVRIVDLEILLGYYKPEDQQGFDVRHDLGEIHYGANFALGENAIGDRQRLSFNIFTYARNGKFLQEVRFEKVAGVLLKALRITRSGGEVVREEIDLNFPLNAEGKVVWDRYETQWE
ncbi:hypothetical protein C4K06_2187 [Pseudomonas chlororaphis subsp. aureofaciens]|uniref:hypothetical protein n=1 Tax=Pseudomonas chlororaphis TaxID=587753 RepID=UPI000F583AF2|nr:hypothetical protein [Pseudomonas chlororaphis]AZE35220.1 hypothetical protein C4K06_2187 [Pseudomonas chlororaphis subsp. aureofaciens]